MCCPGTDIANVSSMFIPRLDVPLVVAYSSCTRRPEGSVALTFCGGVEGPSCPE